MMVSYYVARRDGVEDSRLQVANRQVQYNYMGLYRSQKAACVSRRNRMQQHDA